MNKEKTGGMTKMHIFVLVASCIMAWGVMGMMNAYGVFFTPMGEALGVGRAAVTLHYSLRTLMMGLASPVVAWLISKQISPRKTMPVGMVIYLVMSILIAMAKSVIAVNIFAIFCGLGFALFSYMIITIILGNWFHKNLGTYTGIAMAFSGIGSAVASPIVTKMIALMGFQTAYIVYTVVTIAMVVPILFCAFRPEDIGLLPYGAGEEKAANAAETKGTDGNLDIPFRYLSSTAIIIFVMTFLIVGLTSLNSHLPSLAISNGFTADVGALLLSASMIGNLSFKFVLGPIIDKLGALKGFIIVLTISIIGFLIILLVKGAAVPLLIGGFLYGTVFSLGSLGLSLLVRYLFGNDQYNSVYAKTALITSVGSAVFVTVIGALYDLTGSYRVPVLLGICMAAVSLVLTFILMGKARQVHAN